MALNLPNPPSLFAPVREWKEYASILSLHSGDDAVAAMALDSANRVIRELSREQTSEDGRTDADAGDESPLSPWRLR
jgi:hypothetical protein